MRPEEGTRKGFKFVRKAPVALTEGIVSFEDLDDDRSPKRGSAKNGSSIGSTKSSAKKMTQQHKKPVQESRTPKQLSSKKSKLGGTADEAETQKSSKKSRISEDTKAVGAASTEIAQQQSDRKSASLNAEDAVGLFSLVPDDKNPSPKVKRGKSYVSENTGKPRRAGVKRVAAVAPQRGKAHYPRIPYERNNSSSGRRNSLSGGKQITTRNHRDILIDLIADVCRVETKGLQEYGAEHADRNGLLEGLQAVLARLPEEVALSLKSADQNGANEIEFQPELSVAEKEQILKLKNLADTLRGQSESLVKYEEDIKSLARDHDIWLEGAAPKEVLLAAVNANKKKSKKTPATPASTSSSSSSSAATTGTAVASTAKEFSAVLDELEGTCSTILSYAENASATMTKAKDAQETLYNTYQAVRMGSVSTAPTTEPKELVKGLLRRY